MSPAHKFLSIPFWLAVLFAVFGCVITFVPGAECEVVQSAQAAAVLVLVC
jgi:hypothetical protein